MTESLPDLKVVTISYSDEVGLEVDYSGCSPFEAWAFLLHATQILADVIDDVEDDDD